MLDFTFHAADAADAADPADAEPRKRGPRGRPHGSKDRKTDVFLKAVADASQHIGEVKDAHDLMVKIYKCQAIPLLLRMEAATRAIRVETPSLTSATVSADIALKVTGLAQRLDEALARESILIEGRAERLAEPLALPPPPAPPAVRPSPVPKVPGAPRFRATIDAIAAGRKLPARLGAQTAEARSMRRLRAKRRAEAARAVAPGLDVHAMIYGAGDG